MKSREFQLLSAFYVQISSLPRCCWTAKWLETQGFDAIHPEFSCDKSRIDFAMERRASSTCWR